MVIGRTTAAIIRVKTAKADHVKGACRTYWVFGGNCKYRKVGYPAKITPNRGNPSNMPVRMIIFASKRLRLNI